MGVYAKKDMKPMRVYEGIPSAIVVLSTKTVRRPTTKDRSWRKEHNLCKRSKLGMGVCACALLAVCSCTRTHIN